MTLRAPRNVEAQLNEWASWIMSPIEKDPRLEWRQSTNLIWFLKNAKALNPFGFIYNTRDTSIYQIKTLKFINSFSNFMIIFLNYSSISFNLLISTIRVIGFGPLQLSSKYLNTIIFYQACHEHMVVFELDITSLWNTTFETPWYHTIFLQVILRFSHMVWTSKQYLGDMWQN